MAAAVLDVGDVYVSAHAAQPPVESLLWDVVIVGAGPAGAYLAHQLARQGLRTLLVERHAFPRAKVCGGCLNGMSLRLLEQAGLSDRVRALPHQPIHQLTIRHQQRHFTAPLGPSLAVGRDRLDAELARAAEQAGAVCRWNVTARVEPAVDGALFREVTLRRAEHDTETVRAKVVVVASGLGSGVVADRRELPLRIRPAARIGLGATWFCDSAFQPEDQLAMIIGRDIYVGMVRLGDGRVNLAAAVQPRVLRQAESAGRCVATLLAETGVKLPPGLEQAEWQGTPSLQRHCQQPASYRLFAIGDAAGYIEPFTGEGMAWAWASADAAGPLVVQAVERWRPEMTSCWQKQLHVAVGRHQVACRALAALLARPLAVRASMATLTRFPFLARTLVRQLGGGQRRLRVAA